MYQSAEAQFPSAGGRRRVPDRRHKCLEAAQPLRSKETHPGNENQTSRGFKNKMQVAASHVMPEVAMAERQRKQAEPGTAKRH
jgi:hypothetical protein